MTEMKLLQPAPGSGWPTFHQGLLSGASSMIRSSTEVTQPRSLRRALILSSIMLKLLSSALIVGRQRTVPECLPGAPAATKSALSFVYRFLVPWADEARPPTHVPAGSTYIGFEARGRSEY